MRYFYHFHAEVRNVTTQLNIHGNSGTYEARRKITDHETYREFCEDIYKNFSDSTFPHSMVDMAVVSLTLLHEGE